MSGVAGPGKGAAVAWMSDPRSHLEDGAPRRMGFFTDTSLCIGCKACEVACKEWNGVPDDGLSFTASSYDNTGGLSASTWRHVAFIEQRIEQRVAGAPDDEPDGGVGPAHREAARPAFEDVSTPVAATSPGPGAPPLRWLMASDVCKHCARAGCLDVCPTGALFRTEFGTVVVQDDVCNGCGYCVSACPFGVIGRRPGDGGAHKCTLCYDRLRDDLEPACAKACPTKSIQFGPLDELRSHARARASSLRERGVEEARLYGADSADGVGGFGAFFLLLDEPEVYGLPPDPVVPGRDLAAMWRSAGLAALGLAAGVAASLLGGRR